MSCRPVRAWITLLVVAVLLLLAGGLALPALMKLRVAAAETTCEDRLRRIGEACHSYALVHGGFPPSRVSKNNDAAAYVPPDTGRGNVWITLLPYLGQGAVLDQYVQNRDWSDPANTSTGVLATVIDAYRCPAAAGPRFQTIPADGKTTYLVGFHYPYVEEPTREPFTGFVPDYASMVQVRAVKGKTAVGLGLVPGYSADNPPGFGAMRQNVVTPLQTITDGTSQTTLVSEMSGRPWQYYAGPVSAPEKDEIEDSIWASHDFRIYVTGSDPTGRDGSKGGPCVINCNNKRDVFAFHPGGANILYADGTVRFTRDTMPAATLVYRVTATGDESIPADE